MNAKPKYWIRFIVYECPLCGRGSTYRTRVYDKPKPSDNSERYIFRHSYDWCDII